MRNLRRHRSSRRQRVPIMCDLRIQLSGTWQGLDWSSHQSIQKLQKKYKIIMNETNWTACFQLSVEGTKVTKLSLKAIIISRYKTNRTTYFGVVALFHFEITTTYKKKNYNIIRTGTFAVNVTELIHSIRRVRLMIKNQGLAHNTSSPTST